MSAPLVERLTSVRTASIARIGRDNWPARIVAMLPDSVVAALIASVRSCQIVHPTALTERPTSNMAPHQRRRQEKVWATAAAAAPDANAPLRRGRVRTL